MKIPLKFWRSRFSLDTPFGHHASFAVQENPGGTGIESVEYDTDTGATTILRRSDGIIIANDGFGYFEREQKAPANKSKGAVQPAKVV